MQFSIKTHKNKSISIIDRLKKAKKKRRKKLIYLRGRINVINTIGSMGILRRKRGRWRWGEISVSSNQRQNTVIQRPRRVSRFLTALFFHRLNFILTLGMGFGRFG